MKSIERKKLVKKLDKLFSEYIRRRDGKCLRCGRTDTLQCAHISSRKNLAGRWNPNNAITLCYTHHLFWAHKEPIEFAEWLKENYPMYYDESKNVKKTIVKNMDLNQVYEDLKHKFDDIVCSKDLPF